MEQSGHEILKVVHDYKHNHLIARTDDFYFIFDLHFCKLTTARMIFEGDWFPREYMSNLENWPHCDKIMFETQLSIYKDKRTGLLQQIL